MYTGGIGSWGAGNIERGVYVYNREEKNRIGNCEFRPVDGDVCVCTRWTGDCFDDYIIVRKNANNKWQKVGEFGAYFFGKLLYRLSVRAYHLLLAGEEIDKLYYGED